MFIILIAAAVLALAVLAITVLASRFADAAETKVYGTTDEREIAEQRQADRDHLAARKDLP